MNVSGIDGATPKQQRKWKQAPIFDENLAGQRKSQPETKKIVKGQTSSMGDIINGPVAAVAKPAPAESKPKAHYKTSSAGQIIFGGNADTKTEASSAGGDPATKKIYNSSSVGNILGTGGFGEANHQRSRNNRVMISGPATHSSGGVANIGQSNVTEPKNAFTGRGGPASHSFGSVANIGQSNVQRSRNAFTGTGGPASHSSGGVANIGQSNTTHQRNTMVMNNNKFASSGVSHIFGGA